MTYEYRVMYRQNGNEVEWQSTDDLDHAKRMLDRHKAEDAQNGLGRDWWIERRPVVGWERM